MKDGDVEELSAETAVEATNKDLEELAKPGIGGRDDQDGDESQPKTPRTVPLTAAKISEHNSTFKKNIQ